ncbi:hypothetical protein pb186bvf_001076 [Paramecium bursaria]
MYKQFRHTIRLIDAFGVPIRFNFNGKDSYTSSVGGVITIILVILIIILFQQYISDFSNRKTIFVQIKDNFYSSPPKLSLNSDNFMFAMQIEQSSSFVQSPYFIINVTQNNYVRISNGTTQRSLKQISVEPCQLYHFSKFNDPLIKKQFNSSSMNQFLCPTNNTVLDLQGAFLDQEFSFIKFSVSDCNGFTNMPTWNVSCSDSVSKSKYLNDNGAFRISIYTTNYVINPDKTLDYTQPYLTEDLNFLFQPNFVRQNVNVYFKNYNISTDQNLFIGEDYLNENYIYREENTKSVETISQLQNSTYQPFQLYFRSDYFNKSSQRIYLKADQVLAYFGGIFSTFFLLSGFFVQFYNQNYYKLQMANRLYKFKDLEKRTLIEKKPLILSQKVYNQNSQLDLDDIENEEKLLKHGYANRFDFLYKYFLDIIRRTYKVYPGFQYFIYLITFKKFKATIINKLVDQCLIQINNQMDVKNLIKKIQELDKLKSLVLNKQQIRVFNFSEKPIIQIESQNQEMTQSTMKSQEKNEKDFHKLLDSYKSIVKSPGQKNNMNQTDFELIKHLSPEIQQILDASFVLKDHEVPFIDDALLNKTINISHKHEIVVEK